MYYVYLTEMLQLAEFPGENRWDYPQPVLNIDRYSVWFIIAALFVAEDFAGKSEEEIEMMKLMGFGGFETTKVQ